MPNNFDYPYLLTLSDLIADAIVKRTNPVEDEISRNQADKLYGAAWMRKAVESGQVKGIRRGSGKTSKIIYSRHQLNCLRAFTDNLECKIINK